MLKPRYILQFTLVLSLLSVVLLYPWPGVERGYARVFRAAGNVLFHRFWFWGDGRVHFVDVRQSEFALRSEIEALTPGTLSKSFRAPEPADKQGTLLIVRNVSKPEAGFGLLLTSSRLVGYWPTVWLLALVLAKPMSWSRKGWALLWGMLLVHAFIAFRLSLLIAGKALFMAEKKYAVWEMGSFGLKLINGLEEVLVQNPTSSFMVPTFIWFVVAFSWDEWAQLRGAGRMRVEDAS
ncbi:MAG: hypothetical protein J5J06_06095 [Phycisphaerae bacterium]|nr:hypothetical protein [Phycisphaerae bacterium]